MNEYKLVPVKPTPEMVSKGARLLQIMSLPEREAASVFRAMLAAAPAVQEECLGVGKCIDQGCPAHYAAAPAVQEEPVAWMHSDPGRVDVIHDKVRKLLKDSSDNAGYLHRPLDKSERYTIPLYTAPQPSEQVENWRHDSEDLEALHHNLDDAGVPRCDSAGTEYSAWGRVIQYAKAAAYHNQG